MGSTMTDADRMAAFVVRASFQDLSQAAVEQLKIRVLDALGCAIGALGSAPIRLIKAQLEEFGGTPHCKWHSAWRTSGYQFTGARRR